MIVIFILLIGVIIGAKFFPIKLKKWNEKVQLILVALLIFVMGVSLGNRENFINEVITLGLNSFVLAIIPMILSAYFVYILTKKLFK